MTPQAEREGERLAILETKICGISDDVSEIKKDLKEGLLRIPRIMRRKIMAHARDCKAPPVPENKGFGITKVATYFISVAAIIGGIVGAFWGGFVEHADPQKPPAISQSKGGK